MLLILSVIMRQENISLESLESDWERKTAAFSVCYRGTVIHLTLETSPCPHVPYIEGY